MSAARPLLIFLIAAGINGSCQSPKGSAGTTAPGSPEGMLLLHFFIRKIPGQEQPNLRLLDQRYAPQRLKPDPQTGLAEVQPSDLICQAFDRSGRPVEQVRITDPLRQTFEYTEADGQLAQKTVELDSAHFLLRLPWRPACRSVAIERVAGSEPLRLFTAEIE